MFDFTRITLFLTAAVLLAIARRARACSTSWPGVLQEEGAKASCQLLALFSVAWSMCSPPPSDSQSFWPSLQSRLQRSNILVQPISAFSAYA